jgi:hypothetical protein
MRVEKTFLRDSPLNVSTWQYVQSARTDPLTGVWLLGSTEAVSSWHVLHDGDPGLAVSAMHMLAIRKEKLSRVTLIKIDNKVLLIVDSQW